MGVLFFLWVSCFFPVFFYFSLRTGNRKEVSRRLVLQLVIALRQERLFKKRASGGPLDDLEWGWLLLADYSLIARWTIVL